MTTLHLPEALQRFADDKSQIDLNIQSLAGFGSSLQKDFPGLHNVLFENGNLHSFVGLYVNKEPASGLNGDTPLTEKDEIEIIVAISGG